MPTQRMKEIVANTKNITNNRAKNWNAIALAQRLKIDLNQFKTMKELHRELNARGYYWFPSRWTWDKGGSVE
jgi:hypothetical protein